LWEKLFECQRETENIRKTLLRNPNIDLQKAFEAIDQDNKGYFNQLDLRQLGQELINNVRSNY